MPAPTTLILFFRCITALFAGALITLSLAPFKVWPLGIVSSGLLFLCITKQSLRQQLLIALFFGLGLYGSGVNWVHVSVSQFGGSSPGVALSLTCLFIAGLSVVFSLPFYVYHRWIDRSRFSRSLGFAALWALSEWVRTWLLTGFPWLFLGYAHLSTPLAGWGPIFGVLFISFITAYTGAIIFSGLRTTYLKHIQHQQPSNHPTLKTLIYKHTVICASLWGGGALFEPINWTTIDPKPITIGMAQANIPQEKKWLPSFQQPTIDIFREVSQDLWKNDWVIWPEAAIPLPYHVALPLLDDLDRKAKSTDTVFMTGIIYDELVKRHYYNSIVTNGLGSGAYFKTRLVPFGEYVPLESQLRGLINFFDLPTSIINVGPSDQPHITAGDLSVSPYICYEIVYPDLVAQQARNADLLITISNDAWFGESDGPLQHFEMARMRAIETGRYLIRSTNNGISAIINPQGEVITRGGRFTREAIEGVAYAARGSTPFMLWGSLPVVLLTVALIVLCGRRVSSTNAPLQQNDATGEQEKK